MICQEVKNVSRRDQLTLIVHHKELKHADHTFIEEERQRPAEIRAVRGTVKAAVLEGDAEVPGLVAVLYYDHKPVHFLSRNQVSRSRRNQEKS